MQKKRLTITITSDNFDTVRHVLNTYGDLLAGRERLDTSTTPDFEISMEDVVDDEDPELTARWLAAQAEADQSEVDQIPPMPEQRFA